MKITVQEQISSPPEIVFALLLDIPRWPELIAAIEKIDLLTPPPVAVGTQFRETRIMFGREATEEMTVSEISPPHRLVLTAFSHGTAYRSEHVLEPIGDGTRLRLEFEGTPRTFLARLFTPLALLMRGTIQKQLAADLVDVKRAAEQRA